MSDNDGQNLFVTKMQLAQINKVTRMALDDDAGANAHKEYLIDALKIIQTITEQDYEIKA